MAATLWIFLLVGLLVCLVVVLESTPRSDARIAGLSSRQAGFFYSLIVGVLVAPYLVVLLAEQLIGLRPQPGLGYAVLALQFLLLATTYVRYRLAGVLWLHCAGVSIWFIYAAVVVISGLGSGCEAPVFFDSETGLFLQMSLGFGSLLSVPYGLFHVMIRRRQAKDDKGRKPPESRQGEREG